jgi:glycosyltransferase involved in cell wall biosynthesis
LKIHLKDKINFSVIIPCYNNIFFLEKAIKSVIKQSYQKFEILVVDDGSSIKNLAFLKNKLKKKQYEKIKFFKIKHTGGPAQPRNLAIKKAKGDWIAFLDSDDYWYKEKLNYLNNQIIKNKYDVYCHAELKKKNKKKVIQYYGPFKEPYYNNLLMTGNKLSTSSTVVSKNFIKMNNLMFNKNFFFISVEDYDFWMQLALKGAKFKFLSKVLGVCTIHNYGISFQNQKHINNLFNLVKYHVFKIQNFETNKNKLWSLLLIKLEIQKLIYFKDLNNICIYYLNLFFIFSKSPINAIKAILLIKNYEIKS